ncbi:Exosome complex component RRP41 [Conglomerata obtusa]
MELLTKEGYRIDGRRKDDLRRIEISHEILNNQTNLTLTQGLTIIKCTPDSTQKRSQKKLRPTISFSMTAHRENKKMDQKIDELETILVNTFETILINDKCCCVHIEVVQDDGGLVPAVINAVSLFLCLNAVPIFEIIVAVQLSNLRGGIVCDSSRVEEGKEGIILAMVINNESVNYINVNGRLKERDVYKLYEKGKEQCYRIFEVFTNYLRSKKFDTDAK